MKKIIILLAFCVLSFFAYSQRSNIKRQEEIYNLLLDSCKNEIDLGMGYVGYDSDNIYYIRELLQYKRYDLIKKLLYSKTPATKFLACETILLLNKKEIPIVNDSITLSTINQIQNSKETFMFYSGCSGRTRYSLELLFNKKDKTGFIKWIKKWIRNSLK